MGGNQLDIKKLEKLKGSGKTPMRVIASLIIKSRYIIILLFIIACIYSILSMGRVRVNTDLTAFLPPETDTRRGLTIMEDEFITYGTANIMVANITQDTAAKLKDEIEAVEHVTDVTYDETNRHYSNASALFSVSFDGTSDDPDAIAAMNNIKEMLADYDVYVSSGVGSDFSNELASQMTGVIALTVAVIIAVLLLTSRSYFEVVIFMIVFAVAGILNMGTNFWLGEISSITNSIAIILQLALAIDYAIIFCHRYQDAAMIYPTVREALEVSLADSIIEISSSSLTTVSGLIALTFMQFRLGYDLGIVLTKGIIFSMITVFLLMPGLIMLFPKALKRTAHKNFVPDISAWGKVLVKSKVAFVLIFAIILPFAVICSGRTVYAFDDSTINELVYSESRDAMHKIKDTFDNSTTIALIVPSGDFESEKQIIEKLKTLERVETVTGLAGIEIEDAHVLTDEYTPRMLSLLLGIDYEEAKLLYQAYGLEHEEYQAILGNAETYSVPLIDMFLYLFEKIDQGAVTLEGDAADKLDDLRGELERGVAQLRGENYDRIIITADVPVEGDESISLVNTIRGIGEDFYGAGNILTIGNITSAKDLADSYNSDSFLINAITIAFVFIVLLFTFKSLVGSVLLVFVIQGSIWINFSFPYLMGSYPSFVTSMIVSAIQMGATIDYAIVLMNRYQELKKELPKKEAMVRAVNESFPTVLTSGSIMAMAGLLISFRVSDVYIGHIGLAVGRGAIISVILVLTALPQLIVLLDKLIDKTKFTIKLPKGDDANEADESN